MAALQLPLALVGPPVEMEQKIPISEKMEERW